MPAVRPKIAELVFQLYGRPLHPVLFEVHQTRTIERSKYRAKVQITSAGHLISWQHDETYFTEVAAAANHPLPENNRLLSHRLRGSQSDSIQSDSGVRYQVNFQLESIAPEVFWSFQQKLIKDESRKGMLHSFDSSGRVAMGAMSYINIDSREKNLLVQCFHTFPDDSAIVKSESRFLLP
ncbi:MAG: DUF2617 family protein [Planctomycetales bacterium]|nr:DUF2617 family protein [Planctomycetales bacterium]